jgi:hypothetical protein
MTRRPIPSRRPTLRLAAPFRLHHLLLLRHPQPTRNRQSPLEKKKGYRISLSSSGSIFPNNEETTVSQLLLRKERPPLRHSERSEESRSNSDVHEVLRCAPNDKTGFPRQKPARNSDPPRRRWASPLSAFAFFFPFPRLLPQICEARRSAKQNCGVRATISDVERSICVGTQSYFFVIAAVRIAAVLSRMIRGSTGRPSRSALRTSLPEMNTGFSSLWLSIRSTRPSDW